MNRREMILASIAAGVGAGLPKLGCCDEVALPNFTKVEIGDMGMCHHKSVYVYVYEPCRVGFPDTNKWFDLQPGWSEINEETGEVRDANQSGEISCHIDSIEVFEQIPNLI